MEKGIWPSWGCICYRWTGREAGMLDRRDAGAAGEWAGGLPAPAPRLPRALPRPLREPARLRRRRLRHLRTDNPAPRATCHCAATRSTPRRDSHLSQKHKVRIYSISFRYWSVWCSRRWSVRKIWEYYRSVWRTVHSCYYLRRCRHTC